MAFVLEYIAAIFIIKYLGHFYIQLFLVIKYHKSNQDSQS